MGYSREISHLNLLQAISLLAFLPLDHLPSAKGPCLMKEWQPMTHRFTRPQTKFSQCTELMRLWELSHIEPSPRYLQRSDSTSHGIWALAGFGYRGWFPSHSEIYCGFRLSFTEPLTSGSPGIFLRLKKEGGVGNALLNKHIKVWF